MSNLEIGLDTFGDRTLGSDGTLQSHAQVIRNLVEQAELADRVGLAFERLPPATISSRSATIQVEPSASTSVRYGILV
jgi:hypothetical protein